MAKLTAKQRRFAHVYDGNGTKAAREAGYSGGENVLAQVARENLRKPQIRQLIDSREEKQTKAPIASREERQVFWSRTMLDESIDWSTRLRASELLGKSQADFIERVEHQAGAGFEAFLLEARKVAGK